MRRMGGIGKQKQRQKTVLRLIEDNHKQYKNQPLENSLGFKVD